ncbi:FG-GAP repeat protein [compost metagenome]
MRGYRMRNWSRYGATLLTPMVLAATAVQAQEPAFTPVQPETFGVVGSLSSAWADFDNDGDLDFAVSLKSGEVRLYRNDGGVFTNIGGELGLPTGGDEIRGLSWGDFDGDGFVDLLGGSNVVPVVPGQNRSYVWKSGGGRTFVEVAAEIGLTIPERISRQANWIDFDNDGRLDLYASNRSGPNQLYRNEGGHFVKAGDEGGVNDLRPTVGSCWFDYNRDGRLDLFLANQSGATDALWRNDGGAAFVDVAPALGMDQPGRDRSIGGVGCAIGDYNNDGNFDVFVAVYGANLLYRNNGDGSFSEVAAEAGVDNDGHAVGAAWGDYDNDGHLDLFVATYEGEPGAQTPLNLLYHNDGNGHFTQVLTKDSLLNAADHSAEWIDYNADGALDLTVTRGYGPVGGHFLFRNDLNAEARARSLSVLVLDAAGRAVVPGAEVRLFDQAGKIIASRQAPTGGGYNAQSAIPVHFGLKTLEPLTVEVTYMSPTGPRVQKVTNVDPSAYVGQSLKVVRTD